MKIAVGTKNPNKLEAVSEIIKKIWADAEIISLDVISGISDQPLDDDETILGATNRAKNVLKQTGADLGIGIEGGLTKRGNELFVTNWAVVIDKENNLGIGAGPSFILPEQVAKEIDTGKELGEVMNNFTGAKNIKHVNGAVGIFTNNLLTRKDNNQAAVICALAKIINKDLYTKKIHY